MADGKIPLIDIVWQRIIDHAGRTFTQKEGKPFTYTVKGPNTVHLDTTERNLAISDVEKALGFVPLKNPAQINDLNAPSYLYAILMDDRIRCLW